MNNSLSFKFLVMLLFLSLLTACQTLGERKRAQSLQDTLRSYEATVRWSSGQHAVKFQDPELATADVRPQRKDIRVTGYEVVQGPTMLGEERAVQTAVIQYVLQESQIVKEIADQQVWLFDEEQDKWYLNSQPPEFK
ncbi:MAG: asparagine synthetase [Candidatus Thiodiazotropha sp.]